MKLTAVLTVCIVALGLGASTPAWAADKETRQMMADIRMLQEQSQQLQNLVTALTDAVKAVDARLSSRIDEQTNTTRKSLADQKLTIDTVSNDLRIVREKVDDSNVRVGTLSQEVDALRQLVTQINGPRSAPAGLDDTTGGAAAAPDSGAQTAPAVPTAVGASPKKIFDEAMSDYYGGDYELAISGFEAYIKSFPQSEQAADAQVNIGNCFLNAAQYQKAVEAYDTAIRMYPNAGVLSDAYYRKGVALQSLNQSDAARDAFQTAVKNYPNTDAARLAAQRLPELKKP